MRINISKKMVISVVTLVLIGSALAIMQFTKEIHPGGNTDLLAKKGSGEFTSKGENITKSEYTSKRILAIISDTKWREGHIQFDHLRLMGFNLTIVKAEEYKPRMLESADVVMFDYEPDSLNVKDKDSIRDFVEKKGKNVIFISPEGLNIWWKKKIYANTPFNNLDIKAIKTRTDLKINGQIIPSTQHDPKWIYKLNSFGSQDEKVWSGNYFVLSNVQIPIAYTLDFPSSGHYIIYSGSHLTLLPPELIQSLIYLDEPHFEAVYTKDQIKNNFTYLIRIDDVYNLQSKKLGHDKEWDSMITYDRLADNYGFGVNHLVILNRTQGADDVLAYLRGYKNGKWIAAHGWDHHKQDKVHPEFEIDDKAFQDDLLRKTKERFYELFGYYPEYIATPWNAHRYNFSKYMNDTDYGSLTALKKSGFFVYSLYAEQGNTYTPFMVDDVIIIQQTPFGLKSSAFNNLIRGASDNGWIIENYGHYFDENISQRSKTNFDIISKYNVWNPNPNELSEFLHALSGLNIEWKISENDAEIVLKSKYVVPAGFTIKLVGNKSINEVYIDGTSYNYFTNNTLVFSGLDRGTHTAKIHFKSKRP